MIIIDYTIFSNNKRGIAIAKHWTLIRLERERDGVRNVTASNPKDIFRGR